MKHALTRFMISMAAVLGLFFAGPAGAAGPVELNMYYPIAVGGPLTKLVDDLVAGFEKENPDIKVNAIYAGNYDDARIKALAALKSGKPAQLSVLFSIDIYELIEQNAIVAFDDIVKTAEEKAWLKSFYPGLMSNGTFKGKVYGIPFQRSTIVMYYNKDAFKEAGLDPNKPPTTWTEMVEMGKKLVKRDASGQVQRWGVMIPSTGYAYWMFQALAIENGQVLMNADGDRTYYDNPAVIQSLQYWYDLSHKYGVMPKGTVEWGTLRADFLDGKTAIMWHTTGNLTAVKDNAKFDFGVAMLPASKRRGSPTGGGNFYIFRTDHARGARCGAEADPLSHRAGTGGEMEHRHGLSRHVAGRLRDQDDEGLCRWLSVRDCGARPLPFATAGFLDFPDWTRAQAHG